MVRYVRYCGRKLRLTHELTKPDHDTKRESLEKGEGGQEDIIEGDAMSLPV